MLLSKSCIYGLRASLFLAASKPEDYTSIKEISSKLGISFHFLTKILQQLTAKGLLESQKGPKGGVRLVRRTQEVKFIDVVVAIDGESLFRECVLGLPGCGTKEPCPLHNEWGESRNRILEMFNNNTLIYLTQEFKNNKLRLNDEGSFKSK
jgi:Rrf2 family protein